MSYEKLYPDQPVNTMNDVHKANKVTNLRMKAL